MRRGRIPVILDTDIGHDTDDTWALALLLKSPELDLRLVVSESHDTTYSAKLAAKMLAVAGRADVPVGVGLRQDDSVGGQAPWVEEYHLASYPGPVHEDGVGALVETVMSSPDPITLVCIGPVSNIAAALAREPRLAERAQLVAMCGSIRIGYDGRPPICREGNVAAFPEATRQVFAAPWSVTITPVDTSGRVMLHEEKYRAVRECEDPVVRAVIENYRLWCDFEDRDRTLWERHSWVLHDTVAVYLAFREELLVMEELGLRVTDDGHTLVDERAPKIRCATQWRDLSAFEDFLVERLTGRDPELSPGDAASSSPRLW